MTLRIRPISGKGALYDQDTKIPEVSYIVQLYGKSVLRQNGETTLRISDLSITITSLPGYDIYPYVERCVMLRLEDGRQIPGAIISMNGAFLTNGPMPMAM
jgi:hypothetical protein